MSDIDPGFIHRDPPVVRIREYDRSVSSQHETVEAKWNENVRPVPRLEDMTTDEAHRLGFQEGYAHCYRTLIDYFAQYFDPSDYAGILGG